MRLHHLDATAFGPFATTVAVDFDALSRAGLFLLTGATGAGKTSVLDAVCFALYGEVPGDRQGAKRLRCDQAPADVATEVRLELTMAGRRFRIVRSPAWERPKKRGTGTTTEPASVRLSERVDGSWIPLSSRLDETGLQITGLLGMNAAQFYQVVMLPQGRFQSFLRARSEERHRLLQRLFRTARFEEVERWLGERRRTLRRWSARHADDVAGLVNRISEVSEETLPVAWDVHDLSVPAAAGEVASWATRLRGDADLAAAAAAAHVDQAAETEGRRAETLDRATRLAELQRAHAQAAADRDRLAAAAEDHAGRVRRVDLAQRAARVVPLHVLASEQAQAADEARRRAETLTRAATQLLGLETADPTGHCLETASREADHAAATARDMLPRERALVGLRAELDRDRAALAALGEERERVDAELTVLPQELARLRDELGSAIRA
ncbi:MAG: AAA family ATPase, partial [Nocardioides sp.]